jgi:hypothetical protein
MAQYNGLVLALAFIQGFCLPFGQQKEHVLLFWLIFGNFNVQK